MVDENFVYAVRDFLNAIKAAEITEDEITELLARLNSFAPHSELSDIIFYGERDRTPAEIADEALLRERIWSEGGKGAVTLHVEQLMRAALANPNTDTSARYAAMSILESIEQDAKQA